MLMICIVVLTLSVPAVSAQSPTGFAGRWVGEDTRMGAGGEAVASPIDTESLPRAVRTPDRRELLIEEGADSVTIERPGAIVPRLSLPWSGVAVRIQERAGPAVTARGVREGAALVIRWEHHIRLGGHDVLIQVEERYELMADGTLRVHTTSKSGELVDTQRADYRRVQ